MLTGKKIFLVLAWGGVNPEDAMKVVDFQKPYQRHLLSFAGMKDVAFERVEGIAFGPVQSAFKSIPEVLAKAA
jgi:FMN-dependent NADH-azoreductase